MTDLKPEEQSTAYIDSQQIHIKLDNLERDVKEVTKYFKSIQRSLDAIYHDRDLLTDIQQDITKVRGLVLDTELHNEVRSREMKEVVEVKTDEVKKKVDSNLVLFGKNIINGIHKAFTKEDTGLKKRGFWNRLIF
jgi:hypothetical protein